MNLTIKSFKCYTEKKVIFTDGIVLLRGLSGAGKTTILQAIIWLLYGKLRGVSPRSDAKAKTSVSMVMSFTTTSTHTISIERRKNPGYLRVVLDGMELVGDDAQAVIVAHFGDYRILECSSYIPHKALNAILTSSASERMAMLNSIAFNDEDPAISIGKIDAKRKEMEILFLHMNSDLGARQSQADAEFIRIGQVDMGLCCSEGALRERNEERERLVGRTQALQTEILKQKEYSGSLESARGFLRSLISGEIPPSGESLPTMRDRKERMIGDAQRALVWENEIGRWRGEEKEYTSLVTSLKPLRERRDTLSRDIPDTSVAVTSDMYANALAGEALIKREAEIVNTWKDVIIKYGSFPTPHRPRAVKSDEKQGDKEKTDGKLYTLSSPPLPIAFSSPSQGQMTTHLAVEGHMSPPITSAPSAISTSSLQKQVSPSLSQSSTSVEISSQERSRQDSPVDHDVLSLSSFPGPPGDVSLPPALLEKLPSVEEIPRYVKTALSSISAILSSYESRKSGASELKKQALAIMATRQKIKAQYEEEVKRRLERIEASKKYNAQLRTSFEHYNKQREAAIYRGKIEYERQKSERERRMKAAIEDVERRRGEMKKAYNEGVLLHERTITANREKLDSHMKIVESSQSALENLISELEIKYSPKSTSEGQVSSPISLDTPPILVDPPSEEKEEGKERSEEREGEKEREKSGKDTDSFSALPSSLGITREASTLSSSFSPSSEVSTQTSLSSSQGKQRMTVNELKTIIEGKMNRISILLLHGHCPKCNSRLKYEEGKFVLVEEPDTGIVVHGNNLELKKQFEEAKEDLMKMNTLHGRVIEVGLKTEGLKRAVDFPPPQPQMDVLPLDPTPEPEVREPEEPPTATEHPPRSEEEGEIPEPSLPEQMTVSLHPPTPEEVKEAEHLGKAYAALSTLSFPTPPPLPSTLISSLLEWKKVNAEVERLEKIPIPTPPSTDKEWQGATSSQLQQMITVISTSIGKEEEMEKQREKQKMARMEQEKIVTRLESLINPEVEREMTTSQARIRELETLITESSKANYVAGIKSQMDEYRGKVGHVETRYRALERMKVAAIETECVILQSIVDTINTTVADLVEIMFTEPITVLLHLHKETKTTSKLKPLVNLTISYKGMEYGSIDEVSGGEASRISLALTLAIHKIAGGKFIFLDESLSTLDGATVDLCLKAIKHSNPALAICINHESIEGLYSSVVDVRSESQGWE